MQYKSNVIIYKTNVFSTKQIYFYKSNVFFCFPVKIQPISKSRNLAHMMYMQERDNDAI